MLQIQKLMSCRYNKVEEFIRKSLQAAFKDKFVDMFVRDSVKGANQHSIRFIQPRIIIIS